MRGNFSIFIFFLSLANILLVLNFGSSPIIIDKERRAKLASLYIIEKQDFERKTVKLISEGKKNHQGKISRPTAEVWFDSKAIAKLIICQKKRLKRCVSPKESGVASGKVGDTLNKVEVFEDPFEVFKNADVIYAGALGSMGNNAGAGKKIGRLKNYQIHQGLLSAAKHDTTTQKISQKQLMEKIERFKIDIEKKEIKKNQLEQQYQALIQKPFNFKNIRKLRKVLKINDIGLKKINTEIQSLKIQLNALQSMEDLQIYGNSEFYDEVHY